MKRDAFIRLLTDALSVLPVAEREEIVADYNAYFDDGLAAGRSEEDLAAGLGDPVRLARELTAQRRMKAWESRKTPSTLWRLFWALAGLGALNALIAIPAMIYLSIVSALTCAAGVMLTCGLLLTGGWASHAVFGWPALESATFNVSDEGGGFPGPDWPEMFLRGRHGESVVVHHDPATGVTRLSASDARSAIRVERARDGRVERVEIVDDGSGERLSLAASRSRGGAMALLSVGLVLLGLGAVGLCFGVWLLRLSWRGLLALARMQLAVIREAR